MTPPTDDLERRDERARALFGRMTGTKLVMWSEETRLYWCGRVDGQADAEAEIAALREALETAQLDLNHLATKYDEQEFVAPTICKIATLTEGADHAE